MNGPHFPETRDFYTMGSGRGLARVIMEMRNEIKKLESENKVLRGEVELPPAGRGNASSGPPAFQNRQAAEETPSHANLRRNASVPTLERQNKENIKMTVRRYSICPNMMTTNRKSEKLTCGLDNADVEARDTVDKQYSDCTAHQEEKCCDTPALLDPSSRGESTISPKERLTNRRSLQEYVHKNRAKVKTVTFLLPVEDIYTNQPFLANHRPGRNTCDLGVIVEKDS